MYKTDKAEVKVYLLKQRFRCSSGRPGVVGRSWLVTRTAGAVLLSWESRQISDRTNMRPEDGETNKLTSKTLGRGTTSRRGSSVLWTKPFHL